jgi:hypothetical protein
MVTPISRVETGRAPFPVSEARSTMRVIDIVRRNLVLCTVCGGVASMLTISFAGVVWWIFRPPSSWVIAYAALLLVVFLIISVLLILIRDRKPRGRILLVVLAACLFLFCGLIPGVSFYAFAVNHDPPGDVRSHGALIEWEYAEYGYFGDAPDPVAAAKHTCSATDRQAILKSLGDYVPEKVRQGIEARGFRDVDVRYSWSFPPSVGRWVEPTGDEVTIPQVLVITMSWWRTPAPDEGRTEPYLMDVQTTHRVDFGMRRNSYGRWCVHSAKYLGPVGN